MIERRVQKRYPNGFHGLRRGRPCGSGRGAGGGESHLRRHRARETSTFIAPFKCPRRVSETIDHDRPAPPSPTPAPHRSDPLRTGKWSSSSSTCFPISVLAEPLPSAGAGAQTTGRSASGAAGHRLLERVGIAEQRPSKYPGPVSGGQSAAGWRLPAPSAPGPRNCCFRKLSPPAP